MNERLTLLIALQGIDTKILSTRRATDALPGRLAESAAPLREAEAVCQRTQQALDSLEKRKRDKEQLIEDLQEKIRKIRLRSSEIKTNKEYQANLKEIETVEREISSAEDDLLVILEDLDRYSGALADAGARLAEETRKAGLRKAEIDKEIALREEDLRRLKDERKALADRLDRPVYDLYMATLRIGRGLAVVEAVNEVCQGCNIHIPPQLFVELKSTDELVQCPQCKRIIYYVRTDKEGQQPRPAERAAPAGDDSDD